MRVWNRWDRRISGGSWRRSRTWRFPGRLSPRRRWSIGGRDFWGREEHMSGVSNLRPTLNIGIEEEYQTVDPATRDLRSHIHAEIVEKGRLLLHEHVKPEMHQSV